jgi:hypothetical protein
MSPPNLRYRTVERRDWKNFKHDAFYSALEKSPLLDLELDRADLEPEEMCRLYDTTITQLLNESAPLKKSTFRDRPSNVWFDDECRTVKSSVRSLERRFLLSGDPTDRLTWIDGVRSMHALFCHKKCCMTIDKIDAAKNNSRLLWRTLDTALGRTNCPTEFEHTADSFAQFFDDKVISIRQLTQNAAPPTFCASPPAVLSSFDLVSVDDVTKLILVSPNKQSQLDPLPTWLLKKCVSVLAPFITALLNASISSGVVPLSMKTAIVTPILKKPTLDSLDLKNFRPVSNLSLISKLLERSLVNKSHSISTVILCYRSVNLPIECITLPKRHS